MVGGGFSFPNRVEKQEGTFPSINGAGLAPISVWMDTVGSEQHINDSATTHILFYNEETQALSVPNSANCASMGRTVKDYRSVFVWDPDDGAYLKDKDSGRIVTRLDEVGNVLYFPAPIRTRAAQKTCRKGAGNVQNTCRKRAEIF